MSQQQWYMAIGGHQVGPVSQDDVVTNLRTGTIDGSFGPATRYEMPNEATAA